MKRILLVAVCAIAVSCAPDIEKTEAPSFVTARFDPSQTPPVVPTPNDLAKDPATGRLGVTPAPDATDADKEFTAYLNTLNGFPASSGATATFDGLLDATTVTASNVRVIDVTGGNAIVGDAVITYAESDEEGAVAPARIEISRPTGWKPGNKYLIALVGGSSGLKGKNGETVVSSATFGLLKSEKSLVSCNDSGECKSVTAVIPTDETDPAAQVKDRDEKAAQLEQLRLKYKPAIDALGVSREDLALLWTFDIGNNVAMVFDPAAAVPRVPKPNDLAIDPTTGLVKAPIDPTSSAAQQEFTRDYLNSLNGFPITATATAEVAGGDLDPSTVTAANLLVLELDTGTPVTGVTFSYDATKKLISIKPPAAGWKKATQYGIVAISGLDADGNPRGLLDTQGEPVVSSQIWALVRASAPVDELTLVELSDAQIESLTRLQGIYQPLVDTVVAADDTLTREDVVLGWTFRTLNHPEATFDLTSNPPVIPFPNSLAMSADGGLVNLPNPTNNPLITGLNTIDGFSLTAPIISENSNSLGALTEDARVDEESLTDGGWAILPLSGSGPPPLVQACVNCASEPQTDGGFDRTLPDQIQFVPNAPLAEKTTYGIVLKTNVKDTTGREVRPTGTFALLRMENPIADSNGKSLVDGVSDLQAALLEPRRAAFKAFVDAAVAAGTARKDMALAWTFRTQSTVSVLKQLHGAGAAAPTGVDYLVDLGPAGANQVPATVLAINPNVENFYQGSYRSPFLLTGAGGAFGGAPRIDKVVFNLTIPKAQFGPGGAMPATGWPVVIFGHGLGSFRNATFRITNALAAAGYATIFIDAPLHGDRSVCAGYNGSVSGVTNACATGTCDATSSIGSATYGYCIGNAGSRIACTNDLTCAAAGAGKCLNDGQCAGGDFTRGSDTKVSISGWNFVNAANLFATRDQFRQQVVDLGQLGRVIAANTTASATELNDLLGAGAKLDPAAINYAGQSLGGILGTLYTAAAPEVHRSVLNVAGGDPVGILLYAPAFAGTKAAFLANLQATLGVTAGTPAYDQFLYFARMILDPADPQVAAWDMLNGAGNPADRAALIQYITFDAVVPNQLTARLIAAATRNGATGSTVKKASVFKFDPTFTDLALPDRHGFLLNAVNTTITGQGQQQAATFLLTGAQP